MNMIDILNQVNANAVLGIMVLVYVIVWGLKMTPAFKHNEYLPIISIMIGLIIGAFMGHLTSAGLVSGFVDGALAGAISSGGHEAIDAIKSFIGGK